MFKGICVRYFSVLSRSLKRQKVHPEVVAKLDRVIVASADAILKLPQENQLYPLEWQQPPRAQIANYNTQLSALIALAAAL
jgi:hypothetical protein